MIAYLTASLPDINEAGRVMAELEGFTLLFFVMLFIIVALLAALLWAFAKLAKAIEVTASVREAINTLSHAALSGSAEAQRNHALLVSLEAAVARLERKVEQ